MPSSMAHESHHLTLFYLVLNTGHCSPFLTHLAPISMHEDKINSVFFVHTCMFNLLLTLNFMEQPPNTLLKLDVHAPNSPAYVQLYLSDCKHCPCYPYSYAEIL
jgi:hypothetical protein